MPSGEIKTLEFSQNQIFIKTPCIIYEDLENSMKKWMKNNPEKSSKTKVGEHIPSVFQCLRYLHLKS